MVLLRIRRALRRSLRDLSYAAEVRELLVNRSWGLYPDRSLNPLTASARRYWSQADEDGILGAIFARIGPREDGFFIEFGAGDGRENNTLALLARGWSGVWVGNEDLVFDPVEGGRLLYLRYWVDSANIVSLAAEGLRFGGGRQLDLVSIDLDGNDYHFMRLLLESGMLPRVWVCEYNARFPVGSHWVMPYSAEHVWAGDDYHGASISSMADLLAEFGYVVLACSAQGANLFAVSVELLEAFPDVPLELETLYQPPHFLIPTRWGHDLSPRTLRSLTDPAQTAALGL